MDELAIRMLYQHVKGKIFYVIGTAENENKNTVVIMSSVDNGKIFVRPIEYFVGQNKTFELVIPSQS